MGTEKKVDQPLSKFGAFQEQKPQCPKCGSIIYSRRNVLCGACGERLPKELLFTPEQREMVEKELKDAKKRTPDTSSPWEPGGVDFIDSTDFGSV